MSKDMQRKLDRYQVRVPDPTLAGLAEAFAGDADGEHGLGVTLIVGGSSIGGVIVSERIWVEAIGRQQEDLYTALSKQMLEVVDSKEQKPELSNEEYDELDEGQRLDHLFEWSPSFIHLVRAQQLVGEHLVPTDGGVPMRIRLSEVQGWSLGKLEKGDG